MSAYRPVGSAVHAASGGERMSLILPPYVSAHLDSMDGYCLTTMRYARAHA
jgi:hypothetical protein